MRIKPPQVVMVMVMVEVTVVMMVVCSGFLLGTCELMAVIELSVF